MTYRVISRGYGDGRLIFEEPVELTAEQFDNGTIQRIAEHQLERVMCYELHMIELEFPDEPNPLERYARIGTDTRRMVAPLPLATYNVTQHFKKGGAN